ncbi:MAG: NAD-dependent epimerase/dehydratase family protein [Chloroflexi bacterium]|nr:NAD-dependent epimerase/dehydratase family protein [Chloroflexota bacterium]
MAKTALVTGASGFTGSNLARKLAACGYSVRALVRRSSRLDALQGAAVEVVYGDLADETLPDGLMRGVDVVYNIAAMYRHEGAASDFYDVNARAVERLLCAALDAGVSRFVHCSTVGVLGNIENPPANETAPYRPGDWYQKSKLEGEKIVLAFGQQHGLPVSVVRPAAIYGPGDTRFLKLFKGIDRGLFVILGSGEVYYHYVYIDDLVQGFLLAGEKEAAVGEVFIIAGEQYVTINQLTAMIAEALGRPTPRLHIPLAPVMLAARVCRAMCKPLGIEPPLYPRRLDFFRKHRAFDITKARTVLGYHPMVDLRTGLRQTADWYRAHNYL